MKRVWRSIDVPEAGYVNLLSNAIEVAESDGSLFVATDHDLQVIASDYSGQHKGATHEVYSFVVTTRGDLEAWLPLRTAFRERWLPDGRRLSFKQLREPVRRRAYPHFLELCDALRGNVITVMIDNKVGTFIDGGPAALAEVLDDCFLPGASEVSIEKIYRLALLVAMLQAGLRSEEQPSLWISDHDETLDTHEKRERFGRLASYLTFGLTGRSNPADAMFMTTLDDHLPHWAEDLAALPDIAAGACASLSGDLPVFLGARNWITSVPQDDGLDWRARTFGTWLSAPEGVLCHVLLRLAPDRDGNIRASAQRVVRQQ